MRFIFLTPGYHPDNVGGAWRYAAEVATRLAARGHRMEVICQNHETPLPAYEMRDSVHLHRFAKRRGNVFGKWRQENQEAQGIMNRLLAGDPQPALVVLHQAYLGATFSHAQTKRLYMFQGPWGEEFVYAQRALKRNPVQRLRDAVIAPALRSRERAALKNAHQIFTLSRYFADKLSEWHGEDLPPIKVVPAGADLERFAPPGDRAATRATFGLKPEQFLFLAVRRLDPRMGLRLLLEAFVPVAHKHPNALLWLTGKGPMKNELEAFIQAHGLTAQVKLLGYVPEADLPRLLGAADCTLMPSLDLEGFGLATAESYACGTPVIGSRAAANPELIAPFSPELLFTGGSVSALAGLMDKAVTQPEWLPTRTSCRVYAEQAFSWERTVLAFEEQYTRLGVSKS